MNILKPLAICLLVLPPLLTAPASKAGGTGGWYGETIENESDIMMMDMRWPWWMENIYCANWNVNVGGFYFYGGMAGGVPALIPSGLPNFDVVEQDGYRAAGPWSFWGQNQAGETPQGIEGTDGAYLNPVSSGHEGASAFMGSFYPYMKRNEWFTMVARVWEPLDASKATTSYVARFIKENNSGKWHLLGVVKLPAPAKTFSGGNGGFLECFNGIQTVSSIERRLGYYHKGGAWKSSYFELADGEHWAAQIKSEKNQEYVAVEYIGDKNMSPQKLPASAILKPLEKYTFTLKQPEAPTLSPIQIKSATASSNGTQVVVNWALEETSSPQLLYRIEVFDNAACVGAPVACKEERMPQTRMALIETKVKNPTVRFSLVDIFDQTSAPKIFGAIAAPKTLAATEDNSARAGLHYEMLESEKRQVNFWYPKELNSQQSKTEEHYWISLSELAQAKHVQQGICNGLGAAMMKEQPAGRAYKYEGYLNVPATGLYVFHMQASDGYDYKIDGQSVIKWDAPHGTMTRAGIVALEKGLHHISIDYFVDVSSYLDLEWEGPSLARERIPVSAYTHHAAADEPAVAFSLEKGSLQGVPSIRVVVEDKGHQIKHITLYNDRMRLAESNTNTLLYDGTLFEGKNDVYARIQFDTDGVIDSPLTQIDARSTPFQGDWKIQAISNQHAQKGFHQTTPDAFTLMGDGEYQINQKVSGDFTLTCHIDAFAAQGVADKAWVGLMAGADAFGVYQTATNGIRTTANWGDWGGTRISGLPLEQGSWLRMVRSGDAFTAWTSTDGKTWLCGATHNVPSPKEVTAGITFFDSTFGGSAWLRTSVSALKLEAGLPKDMQMPQVIVPTHTQNLTFTGVATSPANPALVILRSPTKGLQKSTDSGKTWQDMHAPSQAVRSVAIDPKNTDIVYCAAGSGASSGLWKTTNGGEKWDKLNFTGDFDSEGPSAICGEIIAIAPTNSDALAVGCETQGVYTSSDAGNTWVKQGTEIERVSAVCFDVLSSDKTPFFCAVTCPDAFIALLGRGNPSMNTAEKVSHSYCFTMNDMGLFTRSNRESRTDVGYLNTDSLFAAQMYCTTHGLECEHAYRNKTFLVTSPNIDTYRPTTAFISLQAPITIQPFETMHTFVMALDPKIPGHIASALNQSYCAYWNFNDLVLSGDLPKEGGIAFARAGKENTGWLLGTDGLYYIDGNNCFAKLGPKQ